jgi:hypothetical protein
MRIPRLAAGCLVAVAASTAGACKGSEPITARPLPALDNRPALLQPGERSPRIANYDIRAEYDPKTHTVTATETLRWKNTTTAAVSTIPLHLYMNAFKDEDSVFMKESRGQHRDAFKKDDSWGRIDVTSIRLAGSPTELRPGGKFGLDETTLEVPLGADIPPGGEARLDIAFTTVFPEVFARTGYKGEFTMAGQWFPKIGVLQQLPDGSVKWHCETFHVNSEFFADFGVYDVTLTLPASLIVAATGVLAGAEDVSPGGLRRLRFHAEDVHDFAWTADPWFRVMSTTATVEGGTVEVRVYHRPGHEPWARRHLEAGKRSIEGFSRMFYPYPWSIMSIIDVPSEALTGAGGMEYPTLVTTGADHALAPPGVYFPEQVTVHEVGHNWFQGLLASNEVDEAWLDEGVNEYVDGLILDEWLGSDRSFLDVAGVRAGYYQFERASADGNKLVSPIRTKSYLFAPGEYGDGTYRKSAQVLKTLEGMAGKDRLVRAIGRYAREFAFKHPTGDDFLRVVGGELGSEHDAFLRVAFGEPGGADLFIHDVDNWERTTKDEQGKEKEEWRARVVVKNTGRIAVPVEVKIRFSDGTEETVQWDGNGGWRAYEFTGKRIVSAVLDPANKVMVDHDAADNEWREDGRHGPAWRAAARLAFWQQTLLQLVGP